VSPEHLERVGVKCPPARVLNSIKSRYRLDKIVFLRDHHLTYEVKICPPNKAFSSNFQCRLHKIKKLSLLERLESMEIKCPPARVLSSNKLQYHLNKIEVVSLRDHHLTYEVKMCSSNKALSSNL
jgi:hypothetical protein